MSKAKAASKEKKKVVELKDVEDIDRPRPTSTRSLLTLKPLPKIDPKDKGKKGIEEEDESGKIPEGFDKVLWADLIVMFNADEQDEFWNSQHKWKLISWKLHSSSGVHTLMTDEGLVIHMLTREEVFFEKEIVTYHILDEELSIPEQTATGKGTSNPLTGWCLPKKPTMPTTLTLLNEFDKANPEENPVFPDMNQVVDVLIQQENDGVNEGVNNDDIEDEDVKIELNDNAELRLSYMRWRVTKTAPRDESSVQSHLMHERST
ncbi:hypothetical protein Tco_0508537 [Tanacetum coccineum]